MPFTKGSRRFKCSDPVFEAVRIFALLPAQVDEEVCGSGCVLWRHVPHDAERVTGNLTNLNVARSGEKEVHC